MTKEKRTDKRYLQDIYDAIESINDFLKRKDKKTFEGDYLLQSAVFRQFEIIGEAASRLSKDFRKQHQEISWEKIIGMRHKMIHDYFEVSIDVVWNTYKIDLPVLKKEITLLLAKTNARTTH